MTWFRVSRVIASTRVTATMSIVTVQLGQCGNQVGHELFDTVSDGAQPGLAKVFSTASRERFFHQTARGGELPGRLSAPHTCLPVPALPSARPGGQSRAGGHGAQSHQAEHQQGQQVRQVALRRGVLLLPEPGFWKQLGQWVRKGLGQQMTPHILLGFLLKTRGKRQNSESFNSEMSK